MGKGEGRGPHHLDDLGDLHWSVGGGNGEERLDDLGGSTILGVGS